MLVTRSASNSKYVIARGIPFIQPEFTSNTSPHFISLHLFTFPLFTSLHFNSLYPDDPPSTSPYLSLVCDSFPNPLPKCVCICLLPSASGIMIHMPVNRYLKNKLNVAFISLDWYTISQFHYIICFEIELLSLCLLFS
jgi:hypothetical protein